MQIEDCRHWYEDFEFRVLETPHFDVYHYAAEEAAIGYAAGAVGSGILAREHRRRVPLVT